MTTYSFSIENKIVNGLILDKKNIYFGVSETNYTHPYIKVLHFCVLIDKSSLDENLIKLPTFLAAATRVARIHEPANALCINIRTFV